MNLTPIYLFSDEPTQNDQFGSHDAIAKTLLEIITTDREEDYQIKKPFVIGLYGKWGSGKSSIIKMLEDKIASIDELRIAVVDAWSVGPKNFPRHILRKTAEKIIDDNKILMDEVLPKITDVERKEESTWELNKESKPKFRKFLVLVALFIFGIGVLGYFNENNFWPLPMEFIYALFFGAVSTYIVYYLLPQNTKTINKATSDLFLDDPSYFREKLSDIFSTANNNNKIKYDLCIVIDNLDRLPANEANEILSTIKTFIVDDEDQDFNNMTFIVPCDPSQIVSEINLNGQKISEETVDNRRNEVLRKYFNTTLTIPPPIWNDLETFTRTLLEQSNLNLNNSDLLEISSSLSFVYGDNPRQIKKFINNLIVEHRYAETLENEGQLEPKITDKMLLFSFFLILQNELRGEKVPQTLEDLNYLSSKDFKEKNRIQDFVNSRKEWQKATEEEWSRLYYFKNPGAERKYKDLLYSARIGDSEKFIDNYTELEVDDGELFSYLNSTIKSESELINLVNILIIGRRDGILPPIITAISNRIVPLINNENNIWLDMHPKALYSHLIESEIAIVNNIITKLNESIQADPTPDKIKWAKDFIDTIIIGGKNIENHLQAIEALISVTQNELSIVVLENPTLNWSHDSVTYAITKWENERLTQYNKNLYLFFVKEGESLDRPPALLGIVVEVLATMLG